MQDNEYVFSRDFKPSQLAIDIVEENFPEKHYGDIMVFESWSMRTIMEQLVEIGIRRSKL